jgi:hypothetical protein
MYHLIVDQESFGVLTVTGSLPVANAVSIGIPNSSVMSVNIFNYEHFQNRSYSKNIEHNVTLLFHSKYQLQTCEANVAKSVPSTNISSPYTVETISNPSYEWKTKRELANIRAMVFFSVEERLQRYLASTNTFIGDNIFIPFIAEELKNPNSPAIEEWANIQFITIEEARADLEIKVKSVQLMVCKINAIWEKYIKKINSTVFDRSAAQQMFVNIERELRAGIQ